MDKHILRSASPTERLYHYQYMYRTFIPPQPSPGQWHNAKLRPFGYMSMRYWGPLSTMTLQVVVALFIQRGHVGW